MRRPYSSHICVRRTGIGTAETFQSNWNCSMRWTRRLPLLPCSSTRLIRMPRLKALEVAARTIGLQIETQSVTTESEIDAVFARLAERRTSALVVDTDAFLFSRRAQLVGLAKRYAISTIFDRREYAEAGGLVSYGGSVEDVYRLAGIYTGRIPNPRNFSWSSTSRLRVRSARSCRRPCSRALMKSSNKRSSGCGHR